MHHRTMEASEATVDAGHPTPNQSRFFGVFGQDPRIGISLATIYRRGPSRADQDAKSSGASSMCLCCS